MAKKFSSVEPLSRDRKLAVYHAAGVLIFREALGPRKLQGPVVHKVAVVTET